MKTLCWVVLTLSLLVLGAAGYAGYYVYNQYGSVTKAITRVATLELENRQLTKDMEVYKKKSDEQKAALDSAIQEAGKVRVVYKERVKVVKQRFLGKTCEAVIENAIKYRGDLAW